MSRRPHWIALFSLTLLGAMAVSAIASSPALSIILPRGGQRGTEMDITFSGARLADGEEILYYEPGITTVKMEPKGANQLIVTVKIDANCRMGEHVMHVRTKSGISEYRTFFVGPFPTIVEKEPNTDFAVPQAVAMNSTVAGVVTNEDVDYYVVDVKKGQRISAEVEGMRLGTTMFDPYVAILDSKRFELSSGDDTPLFWQDSLASAIAPEDGKYYIEVRESAYGGNGNCRYRLHVGTFPRPTVAYPAGGKMGEATDFRFLGDVAGEIPVKVTLPSTFVERYALYAQDASGISPSGNPVRLFEHGNAFEVEPNNTVKEASPVQLPLAFNGIVQVPGDTDFFKFAAKKGQVYEVDCYARRIRSALDPVMNLYYADGRRITGNDDSRGPDSYFRFSVPADGEYAISVTDHLGRGAKDFVYRIEFAPVKPKLTLGIPRVARYSQSRQTIYVPRGGKFASLISASRANFGGELILNTAGLPQGITVHAETMPANMNLMPVVFEAAADAPIGGKMLTFTAKHADPKQKIEGRFQNYADLVRGPGNRIYWGRQVEQLAVAVVDELPFSLEIIEPKVPLVRNGSLQLKIVAHKKEGWDEQINIQFPFRPSGVGVASSINMPKGKNEAFYPLNANNGARIGKWKVYALGSANVNGTAWVSSQLANLEIADNFVDLVVDRTAIEQGQVAEMFCKVTVKTPFEGTAKIRLLGLPPKAVTPELEFTKDTKELVFKVVTQKDTRAGRHKGVFTQVVITKEGDSMVHSTGRTELRVDKPLPAPKKPVAKPTPKPVAKKAEPAKPAPKRLTRLQKLRLEAKERAAAAAAGTK